MTDFNQVALEDAYKNATEYLRKAQDLGRKPAPIWILPLIVISCSFSAYFIGYMLLSYVVPGVNKEMQQITGMAFGLVAIITSMYLSFSAGAQLYRTNLIRKYFGQVKGSTQSEFPQRVFLREPQSVDDDRPQYLQIMARVLRDSGDKGSYSLSYFAMFYVLCVSVGAVYVKKQVLMASIENQAMVASVSSLDLVSFLFAWLILHAASFFYGYKHSFAGIESSRAFKLIKGIDG